MAPDRDTIVLDRLRVVRGGRPVLPDLSVRIGAGALVGVLGPSGSGKTTLLRVIVGAQRVVGGRVAVLGHPAGSPALRTRIGYQTQAPSVYLDLTVVQNLRYFARVLGVGPADVQRVLAAVDLDRHTHSLVRTLSGGEVSRVSLAVALLGQPQVLVLDEPTVGLDPVLRRDLWVLFRTLARGGTTMLVSSHVMDEADRCDRLLLLREGDLIADATPTELLARTGAPSLDAAFLALVEDE